jgi:hypothetical protein
MNIRRRLETALLDFYHSTFFKLSVNNRPTLAHQLR